MKLDMTIDLTGHPEASLQRVITALATRGRMHARMAGSAERWIKDYGRGTAAKQHRSAERLGAKPTKHLERAYASIEGHSNDAAATLLVPRASRLRSAFGEWVQLPGSGRKYITIPACAETYGKRVREFAEGTFEFGMLYSYRPFPVLKFKSDGRVAYWLRRSVTHRADPNLIPFARLLDEAADAAREFIGEQMTEGGPNA